MRIGANRYLIMRLSSMLAAGGLLLCDDSAAAGPGPQVFNRSAPQHRECLCSWTEDCASQDDKAVRGPRRGLAESVTTLISTGRSRKDLTFVTGASRSCEEGDPGRQVNHSAGRELRSRRAGVGRNVLRSASGLAIPLL